jgi:hypothetical protein
LVVKCCGTRELKAKWFWWKMVVVELEFRFAAVNYRDGKKEMEVSAWEFV